MVHVYRLLVLSGLAYIIYPSVSIPSQPCESVVQSAQGRWGIPYRPVLRISGAYPGFSEGGGGVPRSAKQANKPNKRTTGLKPGTCAHQGSMFRPY